MHYKRRRGKVRIMKIRTGHIAGVWLGLWLFGGTPTNSWAMHIESETVHTTTHDWQERTASDGRTQWYFINQDGQPLVGLHHVPVRDAADSEQAASFAWYYFDEQGYPLTGWQKIEQYGIPWHYFSADGRAVQGWHRLPNHAESPNGEHWYYMSPRGQTMTDWQWLPTAGDSTKRFYYFTSDGRMVTGW